MNLKARLKRLERRANLSGTPEPSVTFHIPYNGREPGVGFHSFPGSRAVLVIYEPGTGPPPDPAGGSDRAATGP
jgi:hypothetical protein